MISTGRTQRCRWQWHNKKQIIQRREEKKHQEACPAQRPYQLQRNAAKKTQHSSADDPTIFTTKPQAQTYMVDSYYL